MFSFQGGFLSLCFLWIVFRVVFWFAVDFREWPVWLVDFVYVGATVCQCATFSLLILFYIQLADAKAWASNFGFYATCYGIGNLVMLVLSILFAGISSKAQNSPTASENRQVFDKIYFIFSGIFFGGLVILAAYYVFKLCRIDAARVRQSHRTIVLTSMVFVIFFSRCIFDFVSASNSITPMHVSSGSDRQKELTLTAFILFFFWEIIPSLVILIYFHYIPMSRPPMYVMLLRFLRLRCPCGRTSTDTAEEEDSIMGYHDIIGDASSDGDSLSPVLTRVKVHKTAQERQLVSDAGRSTPGTMPEKMK